MKIRPSNRSDARAMARVYVKTWRDTYLSLIPFGYLSEMSESHHEHAFVRCRRFYERLNGVYMRSERQSFSGSLVEVAVYGWPDTTLIGD
jgi:hypothetical protein